MPKLLDDASAAKSGPRLLDDPTTAGDALNSQINPWEDPSMPVTRDLKTIPKAAKHALRQALNLIGVYSDDEVKQSAAALKADPYYSETGAVVGPALLAAPALSAVGALGAGVKGLQVLGKAAPWAERAINIAGSTATGAALSDPGQRTQGAKAGAIGGTAVEGLKVALPWAAHEIGNRFLNNVAGRISAKNNLSQAATDAAYEVGAIRPWKGIKGAAETLEDATNAKGQEIGDIILDAGAQGAEGPPRQFLVQSLRKLGDYVKNRSADPAEYMPYFRTADELAGKSVLPSGNLTLEQAEAIKTSVQQMAKRAYKAVPGADIASSPGSLRNVATGLRRANERAFQLGASPELYQEFLAAKEGYGPLRDAFRAAGEGAARAGNRSFLSLPDVMMLTSHGATPMAQFKLAKTLLPQTVGYGSWLGGKALRNPATDATIRALLLSGPREENQ